MLYTAHRGSVMPDNDRKNTYDEKGNRYRTYKNLLGEEITVDKDGKKYRTTDGVLGGKITSDDQGNKYRTYDSLLGGKVTIDDKGNEWRTYDSPLGYQETYQTQYSNTNNNKSPVSNNTAGNNRYHYSVSVIPTIQEITNDNQRKMIHRKRLLDNYREKLDGQRSQFIHYLPLIIYIALGILRIVMIFKNPDAANYRFFSIFTSLFPVAGDVIILIVQFVEGNIQQPYTVIVLIRAALILAAVLLNKLIEHRIKRAMKKNAEKIESAMRQAETESDAEVRLIEKKLPGFWSYDEKSGDGFLFNEDHTGSMMLPDGRYTRYFRENGFKWQIFKTFYDSSNEIGGEFKYVIKVSLNVNIRDFYFYALDFNNSESRLYGINDEYKEEPNIWRTTYLKKIRSIEDVSAASPAVQKTNSVDNRNTRNVSSKAEAISATGFMFRVQTFEGNRDGYAYYYGKATLGNVCIKEKVMAYTDDDKRYDAVVKGISLGNKPKNYISKGEQGYIVLDGIPKSVRKYIKKIIITRKA